ncbi:hypothetical protein ACFP7A_09485 [Sporolactobacillus kofuensis]|uniref:Spore coat protein YutH n=1 Tax=Sporolactobacillus kofuensis TaxID=269672 RepID=A0ABW1WE30_9BACL|nr:hypothetical protein [Sporolactobacillus kofuensis]MCO7176045.1 hypothetical protein [Sporolactobacillus kofuensis]
MKMLDWHAIVDREYELSLNDHPLTLYFQPVSAFYHQQLDTIAQWADYLNLEKGLPVSRMFRNRAGKWGTLIGGEEWVLMCRPIMSQFTGMSAGVGLAELHLQTSMVDVHLFPESPLMTRNRDWEKRIDVLEAKELANRSLERRSVFERLFSNRFAYFLGCAENAIQMMVEGSINFPNEQSVCFGHYRYSMINGIAEENPGQWVVDDRSRDLAEALRVIGWQQGRRTLEEEMNTFLNDYESRFPLTEQVTSAMYARLLYPLSYVECCERYFFESNPSEQREQEVLLRQCEEKIGDYEYLLSILAKRYAGQFTAPEWLLEK